VGIDALGGDDLDGDNTQSDRLNYFETSLRQPGFGYQVLMIGLGLRE